MIQPPSSNSAKTDTALAVYIVGAALLFASAYIVNLESGPIYFGLGALFLAVICVMAKGPQMPSRGGLLLIAMSTIAVFNTLFAISREQTAARWLMVVGLYACSLRLTEIPAPAIRRTLEATLPVCLLAQIFALQWHLSSNLDQEKTRLIWHTISLFAGLLVAIGLAYANRWIGLAVTATGAGFIAFSGARGALFGLAGIALTWVVCQRPGRRSAYAALVIIITLCLLLFGSDLLNAFSSIKVVRLSDDPIEHMIKSFEGRTALVRDAFDFAKAEPFFGTGIGTAYFPSFKAMTGLGHPHNSYVGMIIEMGFVIGPLYLIGSVLALINAVKIDPSSRLALLLAPSIAYFLSRGLAENYTLLGLGNFASSLVVLMVAAAINHRAR